MNPGSKCVSQSTWHHQVGSDGPKSWRRLLGTSGSSSAAAAPVPCQEGMLCCSDVALKKTDLQCESRALSKGIAACSLIKE